MRLFLFFALILSFAAVHPLPANPLNPFSWFGGGKEARTNPGPEQREQAQALLEEARGDLDAGNFGAAHGTAKTILEKYPRTPAAAGAFFIRGRVLMERERWVKAFDEFQKIVENHPSYENFDRVTLSQFDCATALMEGARGKIFGVIPGFRQYNTAIEQFEQIVSNAPFSDFAPLSLMNVALLAQQRDNPDEAIDALDRLINNYPQSMLAPDAYFNLAKTYSELVKGPEYDQGSTRQAIRYFEDFLALYPDNEQAEAAEANLDKMENVLASNRLEFGEFYYLYRNNNTAALIFYNETISVAPESDAAERARERIQAIEEGVRPITGSGLLRKLLLAD